MIRNPRGLARALTNVLDERFYLLRWTPRGPEVQWQMSARERGRLRRAMEKLQGDCELAETRQHAGFRDPPELTRFGMKLRRARLREILETLKREREPLVVKKSAAIAEAAKDMGLSYSTLHRLLHGTLNRLSWRNAGRLCHALALSDDWAPLRRHLWPRKRWKEYEERLTRLDAASL